MNINDLSDDDLATCVDEYVKRAIDRVRKNGYEKIITITITASQGYPDADYEIAHTIGDSGYPNSVTKSGNNILRKALGFVDACFEKEGSKPTLVQKQLPPPVVDDTVEAEFEECSTDVVSESWP